MEYRLYFIDQTSHICDVATFESVSDDQAVMLAGHYARGQPMELWRGDCLVQRLHYSAAGEAHTVPETKAARLPDEW